VRRHVCARGVLAVIPLALSMTAARNRAMAQIFEPDSRGPSQEEWCSIGALRGSSDQTLIAELQSPGLICKTAAALELKKHPQAVAAIPALINALGDTRDWRGNPGPGYQWSRTVDGPHSAAVEALKIIIPNSNGSGLDYARTALANGNEDLRRGLAEVLPWYGEQGTPLLLTILTTDDDPNTLVQTEKGLSQLGSGATPALKNLIDSNPKPILRRRALFALASGQDPNSLPILTAALDSNPDEGLKMSLREGISQLATENELGLLQSFLHDIGAGTAAVIGLGRIGSPKAIDVLFECIDDRSVPESTRAHAVTAVSRLNDPRAVQTLLTSSGSSEFGMRLNAVEAMGNRPDQVFVKPLVAALNDSEAGVRKEALLSLMKQKMAKRELFDLALKMLADSNFEMSSIAGKVLGSLTGRNFGTDAAKWNAWLNESGRDFNWGK
jgi:HEAT repeat protein